jgi:hypothetical protein
MEGGIPSFSETVTAWCRDTLAGCRRPHGVALFDLTVTWPGGKTDLAMLEPSMLYGEAELISRLRGLLPEGLSEVSATLFSWGDAAFAAMDLKAAAAVPQEPARG